MSPFKEVTPYSFLKEARTIIWIVNVFKKSKSWEVKLKDNCEGILNVILRWRVTKAEQLQSSQSWNFLKVANIGYLQMHED